MLGASNVAARLHLEALKDQGFESRSTAAPKGRGRSGSLWSFAPPASEFFPERHDQLAVDLIESIRSAVGTDGLQRVMDSLGDLQVARLREVVDKGDTLGERLEALADRRSQDGYMAEVQEYKDGSFLLGKHHCSIKDAAAACEYLCVTELDMFGEVLGRDVQVARTQYAIAGGEGRCVFKVAEPTESPRGKAAGQG